MHSSNAIPLKKLKFRKSRWFPRLGSNKTQNKSSKQVQALVFIRSLEAKIIGEIQTITTEAQAYQMIETGTHKGTIIQDRENGKKTGMRQKDREKEKGRDRSKDRDKERDKGKDKGGLEKSSGDTMGKIGSIRRSNDTMIERKPNPDKAIGIKIGPIAITKRGNFNIEMKDTVLGIKIDIKEPIGNTPIIEMRACISTHKSTIKDNWTISRVYTSTTSKPPRTKITTKDMVDIDFIRTQSHS